MKEQELKKIKDLLIQFPGITAEEVAKKTGYSVHTIRQNAHIHKIKFEGHIYKTKVKKFTKKRNEKIEKIIAKNPAIPSEEIAKLVGLSKWRVPVVLKELGYKKIWVKEESNA